MILGDWKGALILDDNETIVDSWECLHHWFVTWKTRRGYPVWDQLKSENGILALTSHKLIFLTQTGDAYHPKFTMPIDSITSVTMSKKHEKSIDILFTNNMHYLFTIPSIKDESSLDPFRQLLRTQLSVRKQQSLDRAGQERPTKEIIKEKEVIVKIRCPYWKNTYEQTLDKCPHCGGHT